MSHATFRHAPHRQFVVSKYNVRRREEADPVLKSLVARYGVLQNLVVYKQYKNGAPTGILGIVCGRRRHGFVGELIGEGIFLPEYGIPYLLVDEDEAIDISLAENSGRVDMHPADVFEAMLALSQRGRAIEDIALTFQLQPLEVRRRLKLANVAPRLFNLYRNDQASLEQMVALSITNDHAAQEQAWELLPAHAREPKELRHLLTDQQIDVATDRLARYVGVTAFEKAGGIIERDLFSEFGTGYTSDNALLQQLASDKLKRHRDKLLKSEQLPWVDIAAQTGVAAQYGRVCMVPEPLSERQSVWVKAMRERIELLNKRLDAIEDPDDDPVYAESVAEADELAAQCQAIISGRSLVPQPEDVALAGAVIHIDENGEVQVTRNLIRPDDRTKMAPLHNEPDVPAVRRRAPASYDHRIAQDLACHRTAALQAELMEQPAVALRYLAYTLARQTFPLGPDKSIANFFATKRPLAGTARDGSAARAVSARRNELCSMLEVAGDDLLTSLAGQDDTAIMQLLAFCIALSIDATDRNEPTNSEFKSLARHLRLDMAKWWSPTAANYFGHLPKARMIDIVKTAVSDTAAVPLEKLPRDAAAAAAERAMAQSRWLPDALRLD